MRMTNKGARANWFLAALMGMNSGPAAAEARGTADIATARAEQVRELRARGENPGVGTYGLDMTNLVASGHVEPGPGWKNPETATFSGKDDVWSLQEFLDNDAAQLEAYTFYLNGAFEHMAIQKPEVRVEIEGQSYGLEKILALAAYAKPHKLVDLVVSGDPSVLDDVAQKSGFRSGVELAVTAMNRAPDTPSLSL